MLLKWKPAALASWRGRWRLAWPRTKRDAILRIASVKASTTQEVTMKRWLVIVASAVFLFVAAYATKSEELDRDF